MYKILAFIGEAGAGKDTIMQKFLSANPSHHEIISCTTRPIRENEKDGINYYFYTDAGFNKKISNNEMLEYTNFNNWYYGTGLNSLNKDKLNVGVFNPAGIYSLKKREDIKLLVVKVEVSPKERMLRQLNRETDPDCSEIARRFLTDEKDFKKLDFHYFTIWNEDIEDMNIALEHLNTLVDLFFNKDNAQNEIEMRYDR